MKGDENLSLRGQEGYNNSPDTWQSPTMAPTAGREAKM